MNIFGGKKPKYLLRAVLLLALSSQQAAGIEPSYDHESVRSLIQEGSYREAMRRLVDGASAQDSESHLFQLAYCFQQMERWDEAAALYEQLLGEFFPLEDYVHFFLAACFTRLGRWEQAQEQLEELLASEQTLLEDEGRELLAHLLMESGQFEEALTVFDQLASAAAFRSRRTRLWLQMGQIHLLAGRPTEAARLFADIIGQYPEGQEAQEALEELQSIRGQPLMSDELFDAARVDLHKRHYRKAASRWERFVTQNPNHSRAAEALYLSAKASYHSGLYDQAEARYRQLLRDYPRSQRATSAHYMLARIAEADGEVDLAEQRYRQFVRDYSWSQLADEALWRVAGLQEARGDLSAAQREYLAIHRDYASRDRGQNALRKAALLSLLLGDNGIAIELFDLLRVRYPNGPWAEGALFWGARARLLAGQEERGRALLGQVIELNPDGYYASRSRLHLGQNVAFQGTSQRPDWQTLLQGSIPKDTTGHKSIRRHFRKGEALLRLGLLSRAREELSRTEASIHENPQLLADLFALYEEFELSGDAIRLARHLERRLNGQLEEDALETYLFPLSYLEFISEEVDGLALDPLFILSVIRVESLFDPLAVSPAGARGLMQIMPATAGEIAEQLGFSEAQLAWLFRPQWSIRLGVYYIDRQLREFDGRPELALAAYNAGPGSVRRWLRRWGAVDAELFVELIDYTETRRFVQRVLTAQASYGRIWGGPR